MENIHLNNELTDDLKASIALSEATSIVIAMLAENTLFIKEKGGSKKALQHRDRLVKLFGHIHEADNISMTNTTLKLINREYFTKYTKQSKRINELESELDKIRKIDNF